MKHRKNHMALSFFFFFFCKLLTFEDSLFELFPLFVSCPAGFSVSGVTPRQITFNLPASPRSVTYQVVRVTPDGRRQLVGNYPSSTNPTQQTFGVEPGTSYRFEVRAVDRSTGQPSSYSSSVNVNVPSGKWQGWQLSVAQE